MKLLLDFANIRQWDRATLCSLGEKISKSWISSWANIPMEMILRYPARTRRLIPNLEILERRGARPEQTCVWVVESVDDKLMQSIKGAWDVQMPDDEFLAYLDELSTLWRWVIKHTADSGPIVRVLDYMVTKLRFGFEDAQNPWAPRLTAPMPVPWTIEQRLMAEYLAPFISENGEVFKRVRACADPDCGRLFVYNRPKQTFCNDDCRYHFHNVVKIRSGYMADYQRKGRKENPATYLLK